MKIEEIFSGIERSKTNNKDVEVFDVTDRVQNVGPGSLFVAVRGKTTDAHSFVPQAVRKGACAVVVEHVLPELDPNVVQIVVRSTRKALGAIASNFFCKPSRNMAMIGITGTNGKTTTSFMIAHILSGAGKKVGIIGTNGAFWQNKSQDTGMTTPDPVELQKILYQMQKDGVDTCIMEVSAHALDLHKLQGTNFDVSVFTNLTQDHLDYFGTMKNYAEAKARLFSENMSKSCVICTDDAFGKVLASRTKIPHVSYGTNAGADFSISGISTTSNGQNYCVLGKCGLHKGHLPLFGNFNVKNAVAAIAACNFLGISSMQSVELLSSMPPVVGRFNSTEMPNGTIAIVDYAHTPDGIKNVLLACKHMAKERKGRLVCVFGCGGNRDKTKRPQMGKIAEEISDFVFVTTDNPRFEMPKAIADDITAGMTGDNHVVVLNRTSAIKNAAHICGQNDVLAVLGKGAENYMDIFGTKEPYSDAEVISEICKEQKGGI